MITKVVDLDPKFMMYFGSETTPPCEESVIHILVDKPLHMAGCQFKLLRENTLVSTQPKEIHARFDKPLTERTVYTFGKSQVEYMPSIEGLVPLSFNKYVIAHGSKWDKHARLRFLAKKYGPNSIWAKKLKHFLALLDSLKKRGLLRQNGLDDFDDMDCEVPEMNKETSN